MSRQEPQEKLLSRKPQATDEGNAAGQEACGTGNSAQLEQATSLAVAVLELVTPSTEGSEAISSEVEVSQSEIISEVITILSKERI
jgi:hypothetical protein